jgi:sulfate permease, SulP family
LPKRNALANIPLMSEIEAHHIMTIPPLELWSWLHPAPGGGSNGRPYIIDVREPREYSQGHIAESKLIPLPQLLSAEVKLPADKQIVLVCRSGRRSRRAAAALQHIGCMNVQILQGGMLAWSAAGLLEALEF